MLKNFGGGSVQHYSTLHGEVGKISEKKALHNFLIVPSVISVGSVTFRESKDSCFIPMQAYRKWVERNGEEAPLPGMNLTHNQLFFLNYAQVSYIKHSCLGYLCLSLSYL